MQDVRTFSISARAIIIRDGRATARQQIKRPSNDEMAATEPEVDCARAGRAGSQTHLKTAYRAARPADVAEEIAEAGRDETRRGRTGYRDGIEHRPGQTGGRRPPLLLLRPVCFRLVAEVPTQSENGTGIVGLISGDARRFCTQCTSIKSLPDAAPSHYERPPLATAAA